MLRLTELKTDQDFEMFSEILDKIRDANIVATIKQVLVRQDGTFNYMDVRQTVSEAKASVQVNNGYLYVVAQNVRKLDVRRLKDMWSTVVARGTSQFTKGQPNDYCLTIDITKDELQQGYVYCLTGVQPIFVSSDGDNDLTFVFSFDNVRCAKDEVSPYDVDYEVALREQAQDSAYQYDDDEDEDDTTFDENDELLNNDDLL